MSDMGVGTMACLPTINKENSGLTRYRSYQERPLSPYCVSEIAVKEEQFAVVRNDSCVKMSDTRTRRIAWR
jgi:hypothetical protein